MIDGLDPNPKQIRHLLLAEPECLLLKKNFDSHGSVRRGIEDNFVIRWSLFAVWSAVHPNFPSCVPLPGRLLQAPAKQKDRLCRYLLAELALNLRDQSIALLIDGIRRIEQGAPFVVALRLQSSNLLLDRELLFQCQRRYCGPTCFLDLTFKLLDLAFKSEFEIVCPSVQLVRFGGKELQVPLCDLLLDRALPFAGPAVQRLGYCL